MKKKNKKVTSGSAIEMMRRVTTGIRSLIEYSMSAVFSTDTGEHYLYNSGSSREANNSELFSGRHLVLDATQELPIEVPHTLGSEKSTNGTFDTDTAWTKDATVTIGAGVASFISTLSGANGLYQNMSITANIAVKVTFDVSNYVSGNITCWAGGSQTVTSNSSVTGDGSKEIVISDVGATPNGVFVFGTALVSGTFDIDNVSVKQITTPANTGILHFDPTAKEYTQIGADGVGSSVEEVTNGDFSDGEIGWTNQSGNFYVSGDRLHCDITDNAQNFYQSGKVDISRSYYAIVDVESISTGYIVISVGAVGSTVISTAGVYAFALYGATNTNINIINYLSDAIINSISVKEALPVSTTYTFTNQSVGEIAPTTTPFTTADIALMNADNQLLGQLALGSTTTGLSLVTADLYGYYPVSEQHDEFVFDSKGYINNTQLVLDNSFDTGTPWVPGSWTILDGKASIDTTLPRPIYQDGSAYLVAGKTYVIVTRISDYVSGFISVEIDQLGNESNYFAGNGVHLSVLSPSATSVYRPAWRSWNLGFVGSIAEVEIRELTSPYSEITNYLSTVRTNGDNSPYGMQLVGFKQDSLGLPTAVADAGTTQWTADGRTATTGWTVTAPFTVTEVVDGVTYTLTSDANRYADGVADGTYTLPTGEWTLNNTAFDGVTPVTARGTTKMVEAVVIP